MSRSVLSFILMLLTFACSSAMAQSCDTPPALKPNPTLQEQLRLTVRAFAQVDRHKGTERAFLQLSQLQDMAQDRDELVKQWALFIVRARMQQREPDAQIPLMFLELLEVPSSVIIDALAPYLYDADSDLRYVVQFAFIQIDGVELGSVEPWRSPDYSAYKDYIRSRTKRNEPVPCAFARYLFEKAPGLALITFVHAQEGWRANLKDVLWAEHLVSDTIWKKEHGFEGAVARTKPQAMRELDKLSMHDQWWVRLYVAEMLNRHADLGTPEMIDRLKNDGHDLVRQVFVESAPKAEDQQRPVRQNDTQKLQPGGG